MHPKPGHPELCQISLATHLGNFFSQATPLGSRDLLGPGSTNPWATWTPPKHRNRPDLTEKMPQSGNRHPGIFRSSQAAVLELWASLELLTPPGTQLDTSSGHLDAPEAQKRNRLDKKMPLSGNRHLGILQSFEATFLELWASPELLGPPWTQLDTSLSLGKLENSMNTVLHRPMARIFGSVWDGQEI